MFPYFSSVAFDEMAIFVDLAGDGVYHGVGKGEDGEWLAWGDRDTVCVLRVSGGISMLLGRLVDHPRWLFGVIGN